MVNFDDITDEDIEREMRAWEKYGPGAIPVQGPCDIAICEKIAELFD